MAEVEAVNALEDNRERFEPDIQKTIYESDIEVEEKHHGLGEAQCEWTNNSYHQYIFASHTLTHNLAFRFEINVTCKLAKPARATVENVG